MSDRSARTRYHHGDLRSALIATAERLLSESEGWAFTLREVARAAGVSHNAPYNHFSDRLALLAAVAARAFDIFCSAMETAVREEGDADVATRLLAAARGYVGFAVGNPAQFRLMFSAELAEHADATLDAARARSFAVLVRLIEEGVADGVFRDDPHGTHTLTAWSLVHGLSMIILDRRIARPTDGARLAALIDAVASTLVSGLMLPPCEDQEL